MTRDTPDACDHDFDQGGRCRHCNMDSADLYHKSRRTGGAGARRQPTTDREYKQQIRKLEAVNAAESRRDD